MSETEGEDEHDVGLIPHHPRCHGRNERRHRTWGVGDKESLLVVGDMILSLGVN